MNLPAHQPAAWEPEAEESTASGWFPGPLVRKLLLVALAAIALSGSLAAWWVSHAMGQEAMDRLVSQQNDEVELVARLSESGEGNRQESDIESKPVRVTLPAKAPVELVIGAD